MREAEKIRAATYRGGLQPVEKASQSPSPQAQIELHSFSPAACTSEKILLNSQTCERSECAAASRSLFKREPNEVGPFESFVKILFDKLKDRPDKGRPLRIGLFPDHFLQAVSSSV